MNKNKGVTYIELVLAILIAAFIVIGYTQVMTNSSKIMVGTGNDTNGLIWLNETMETIRSKSYSLVSEGIWSSSDSTLYNILGSTSTKKLGSSNITFSRQLSVTELFNGLKAIEVNISWTEGNKKESITDHTMMSER